MEVVKPPPMTGLPPVTGTINVTMRLVADPNLPEPPPVLRTLPPNDPETVAALEDYSRNYKGTEVLFVVPTVYDHSRTFLRIYPNGKQEGSVAAWSNLDFNHFTGFANFRVREPDGTFVSYGLLMGISNVDTLRWQELMAERGAEYVAVEPPELPDQSLAGPSFVVVEGEAEGMAMDALRNLHELYRNEGDRMRFAYLARERARRERFAYLLANPPQPNDVTISFWRRDKTQTAEEEGTR
jgi:hypothetical protein